MPTTALVLVDIQNDYFPGGLWPLVSADLAAGKAAQTLARFREKGWPVAHIQHISRRPGAAFFLPETEGARIHASVAPLPEEPVLEKAFPNSFRDTGLLDLLRGWDVEKLVLCGAMTHMCIDATTRAAFDLGFGCTVLRDACATRDLEFKTETGAQRIPADHVHAAFLAALGAVYAKIQSADAWLSERS
jgi:nicotinamidase-related amidase